MTRRLLQATCILHAVWGLCLLGFIEPVLAAHLSHGRAWALAGLLVVLLGSAGVVLAIGRIRSLMHDTHLSSCRINLVEIPYFIHWCACVFMGLPGLVTLGLAAGCMLSQRDPLVPLRFGVDAYVLGLLVASWGVLFRRRKVQIARHEVRIAGLPAAFDGYRLVHLSDLHVGALTPKAWATRWAKTATELGADLAVVTGDLVTNGVEFHQDIAGALAHLRARDGAVVSLGNHDYFGEGEPLMSLLREASLLVLRNSGLRLTRGGESVYLAVADDTWTQRANLDAALAGRMQGECTVLLAHDPSLFDHAAHSDVALTLSGHTHGGQIAVPFLGRWLSLSHLAHRYHVGFYRRGSSVLYVHPGLGTTGPPIRLGTVPTIAVLTLRVAST